MADIRGILKDVSYGADYYHEHTQVGLDYLSCGLWCMSYADMITSATLQRHEDRPVILDVGCACGAQLEAFRRLGVFEKTIGIDVNEYMIALGRETFGFSSEQLLVGTAAELPLPDASVSLLHSGQVLEHIPPIIIPAMFQEFWRVLKPGGRMFHNLAALKFEDPIDIHDGDPTHFNIKPTSYWSNQFSKAGFIPDFESYDRFVRSPHSPGEGHDSFFHTYQIWTSVAFSKP